MILLQIWMSFSPIADSTAIYFEIDQMQVNWLSIVFMIATIVVGIPAIYILDHCGLRTTVCSYVFAIQCWILKNGPLSNVSFWNQY